MKKHVLYWLAIGMMVFAACQKETSFEQGDSPGAGSLQSDASGDCLPKTVAGSYIAGTLLISTTSTITISVNVTKTGSYVITTDTVNGYYFRSTGTFTTLGATNVTLRSNGTPFAAGVNNFVVSYGASICDIQITVLPAGTGPAAFTLTGTGTPPSCTTPVLAGTYAVGTPLTATNTVTLNVNVTTAGSYNITTPAVNGITFAGSGTVGTGAQTIVLTATGTPTTGGNNTIAVTAGSSTCSFVVNVSSAAAFTLVGSPSCTTPTIAGTYSVGTALTPTNTVTLNVNVTTVGAYNVTTAAVNGMTFSGTGTFPGTGAQTIVLTGTGTPTTGGANNIPVTVGASTCSFAVNVSAGAAFTLVGSPTCTTPTIAGTYTVGTALTPANTVTLNVNVTTAGAYNVTTAAVNGMTFSGSGTFPGTGPRTIVLTGTGTPTTGGANNIPVTVGASSCSFTINVNTSGAVGTLDGGPSACAPITVNGTYTVGTALTAGNSVQVRIDVTTGGPYTITTNAPSGFSFSFTGTAVVGNDQLITLAGTGTPTASGVQNFTVTFGSSTCTFTVTVLPVLGTDYFPRTTNSNWSYEIDDDANDSLHRKVIANTLVAAGNTYNIFMADDGTGFDSSGYYRRTGGDYFERFDYGTWIGFDNPGWGEYIMLKDNVAAGTNWKTGTFNGTITGTPFQIRFSYTILQKDVTISLTTSTGTQSYSNVIVVEEKLEAFDGTAWQDLTATIDYFGKSYYARGIGMIKFEAYDASGAVTAQQELRRYVVF